MLALEQLGATRSARVVATLLAETPEAGPLRVRLEIDLDQFLGAIAAAGAKPWHGPAAGSPWLLLDRLGPR